MPGRPLPRRLMQLGCIFLLLFAQQTALQRSLRITIVVVVVVSAVAIRARDMRRRLGQLGAHLDVTYVDRQERAAGGELPTDGYTMVNAALTYTVKLPAPGGTALLFVRGVNLLDEEARNHVSFLKDIAPLGTRAGQVGVRAQF